MEAHVIVEKFNQGWSIDDLCVACLAHLKDARKQLKKNAKRGGDRKIRQPSEAAYQCVMQGGLWRRLFITTT